MTEIQGQEDSQKNIQMDSSNFSTFNYIQTNYKNSSDIELTDALVFFNKEISKNEHESKILVTKHFDRFIECKSVLETICNHIEENVKLSNFIKYDTNTLKSIEVPEFDIIKRKDEIRKQYLHIFNLKQNIKNSTSPEEFIQLNKKAYKQKTSCKSKYLDQIWEDTKEDRKKFLDDVTSEIFKIDCKFEEMMQFFEFYFEIDHMVTGDETNRQEKIENTILVNIKGKFYDSFAGNIITAINQAKTVFFRIMSTKMSNELKKNTIEAFSKNCILSIKTNKHDLFTYKLILRESQEISDIIEENSTTALKYHYQNVLYKLRTEIINNILYDLDINLDIKEWCSKLIKNIKNCVKIRKTLLSDDFKSKLLEIIDERLKSKNILEEMEYTRTIFVEKLSSIMNVDKFEFEVIRNFIKEMEKELIFKITEDTKKKLENITCKRNKDKLKSEDDAPKIMICLLDLIKTHPITYKEIFNGIKDDIKSDVCRYFIKDLIDIGEIKYTREDVMLIKKYNPMFGFLLNDNTEEINLNNQSSPISMDEKEKELRIDLKTIRSHSTKNNDNVNKK